MIGPISCVPTPQFAAAGSSSRSPAIAGRVTLGHSAEALSSRKLLRATLGSRVLLNLCIVNSVNASLVIYTNFPETFLRGSRVPLRTREYLCTRTDAKTGIAFYNHSTKDCLLPRLQ